MRLALTMLITSVFAVPALAAGASGGHRFPPFDSSTYSSQLFWLFLSFGGLYLLMSRVALPRLGAIIEDRRTTIDGALREASLAQSEAETQATALEQALGKARTSAQAIAAEARDKSSREIETQRVLVEQELAAKLQAAEARIALTKTEAMANVETIAESTVGIIVEQLGGQSTPASIAQAIAGARG
ncbi:AtpF F0F1-type ATP synthase, subunit b [Rhabdaerophilaceae bacterium]